ncbi:MAG: nitronate monooxygenase, partial [Candidatus Methanomethyliaceae archaeon]
ECMAHPNYKSALMEAGEDSTLIIKRSIGRPARALRTSGAEKVALAEQENTPMEEFLEMVSGEVNRRGALEGRIDDAFVWAGQVSCLIRDLPSVHDLIDRMVGQASELMRMAAKAVERP